MIPPSVTLLGTGYTGEALVPLLEARSVTVATTRRPGSLTDPPSHRTIPFDLSDFSTWANLPRSNAVVWIFPAEPADLIRHFVTEQGGRLGRMVALGTTSSYRAGEQDALVSEDSDLDEHQPRVQGEQILMEHGAVILRSAGIYGPSLGLLKARHPLDWLRAGRIASGESYVNLIHVDDLARSIVAALQEQVTGDHFIVSDGTPRRWREIEAWAGARGLLGEVRYRGGSPPRLSRRLSNEKLLRVLRPELRHTELYEELLTLERGRS